MGPSRLTTRTGQDEDDFVEMLGVSLNHNYWIQPLFFLVQISNSAFTGSLRLNPFVHDSLQTERSKNHVPRCSMKFQGSRVWEHAKRHIYRGEAARGPGVRARGPRAPLAQAPGSHRRGDRGLPLGLLRGRRVLQALRLHRRQDVAPSSLTRLQ